MPPASHEGKARAVRIDAHQHFWRFDPKVHTFIDENTPVLRRDYLPEHLKDHLDEKEISGCVAVQAPQSLEETRFLLSLSDAHDFIQAVVGWVDLQAKDLDEVLAELCQHPRLRGIRHIVQSEPDDFLSSSSFRAGVALLPRYGLTYDMLVYERQLPLARNFMAALPDVSFVLDHVGKPDLRHPDLESFLRQLRPIAELPNVVCKLSGLVTEAHFDTWTPELLRPFIEGAASLFGTERLLFGSDWPVCLLAASYDEVFSVIEQAFKDFSTPERARIFGENAARVYGIVPGAR